MSYYRGAATPDRLKAALAVAAVHVALGAAILTGLDVDTVTRAVERLSTFDIAVPEPPPPPPPPPTRPAERARDEEGAAGKKAEPTPVVAPRPKIEVPATQPLPAAPVAGTGSASTAGAAASGTGTGAGGSGMGRGGGGAGNFSGYTPARRISKIPNREYRRFVSMTGMQRGRVGLTVKVNPDGSASNCRIVRSSGIPAADALMCQLTVQYVRFRPARDDEGRPVAQDITWHPDWAPN